MILRVFLLLALLLAPAAQAQQAVGGSLPGLKAVTGVAADDILNIRAAPSASAPILGELSPGETMIEVTALSGDGRWGRVGVGERDGWVSMRYLAEIPFPAGEIPDGMRCQGTEPFWALDFSDGAASYTTPDADMQRHPVRATSSRFTPRGLTYAFAMNHGAGDLSGFIEAEQCSDGMADRTYGWYIKLLWQDPGGASIQTGCCTLDGR